MAARKNASSSTTQTIPDKCSPDALRLFVFRCFKRLRIDLGFTFPLQESTVEFFFTARNDIFRNFDDLVLPIDDRACAETLGYGGDGTIHNVTSASNLGTTGRDRTWSTRATSAKS